MELPVICKIVHMGWIMDKIRAAALCIHMTVAALPLSFEEVALVIHAVMSLWLGNSIIVRVDGMFVS